MIRWDRFLVKILHNVEGGDVKQVCLNLEIILLFLRLLISLSHLCFYILHALIVHIHYLLDIFVLYRYMLGIVCSHLYTIKRVIAAPQLLSREILRR